MSTEEKHKNNIKTGSEKLWIDMDGLEEYEYNGIYMVSAEKMANDISAFENRSNIQELLAKYKYADREDISDEKLESEREPILIDLGVHIIESGPYVCSNCHSFSTNWNEMKSGLYSRILCSNC